MADAGKPIAAINLGRTRADDLLALKIEERCATALAVLLGARSTGYRRLEIVEGHPKR